MITEAGQTTGDNPLITEAGQISSASVLESSDGLLGDGLLQSSGYGGSLLSPSQRSLAPLPLPTEGSWTLRYSDCQPAPLDMPSISHSPDYGKYSSGDKPTTASSSGLLQAAAPPLSKRGKKRKQATDAVEEESTDTMRTVKQCSFKEAPSQDFASSFSATVENWLRHFSTRNQRLAATRIMNVLSEFENTLGVE